ncbi:hypothetical protein EV175_005606 [Coemansia sp. RSA 1933]|nr:hypothetical protein EV175_005606 [Coemansia sp. RSA 1933]
MTDRIHSHLDDLHRHIVRNRYSVSSFCSNESTSSTGSTISNSNGDRHHPLYNSNPSGTADDAVVPSLDSGDTDARTVAATAPEHDHDSANCLSCTRRNVISVFPRFRKVSNRLLSPFRGSQQRASAKCPLEPHSKGCDSTEHIAYAGAKQHPGGQDPSEAAQRGGAVSESLHTQPSLLPPPLSSSQTSSIMSPLYVFPTHPAKAALCLGIQSTDFKDFAASKHVRPSSADRQPSASAERSSGITPLPIIPERLARGCPLLKTTSRGAHTRDFRLDIAQQRITWNSPKKKKLAHSK